MEISFIHMQILVHLHVNKTNFHMKGFALGLALEQRRKATRKSPIRNTVKFRKSRSKPPKPANIWTIEETCMEVFQLSVILCALALRSSAIQFICLVMLISSGHFF